MADTTKKSSVLSRALHGTEKLSNKIIAFITGIFLSAIFFLIMLKVLNNWGLYLGLSASICLNIVLKKQFKKFILLNSLNNGLIAFNIFTVITLCVLLILFFGTVQNALN